MLRAPRHFNHRLIVLVDSKVVVGAAAKGRSSSAPLNRLLRRLAALCFADWLVLHIVLIPTAHNPADAPSRGIRRPRRTARTSPSALLRIKQEADLFDHIVYASNFGVAAGFFLVPSLA